MAMIEAEGLLKSLDVRARGITLDETAEASAETLSAENVSDLSEEGGQLALPDGAVIDYTGIDEDAGIVHLALPLVPELEADARLEVYPTVKEYLCTIVDVDDVDGEGQWGELAHPLRGWVPEGERGTREEMEAVSYRRTEGSSIWTVYDVRGRDPEFTQEVTESLPGGTDGQAPGAPVTNLEVIGFMREAVAFWTPPLNNSPLTGFDVAVSKQLVADPEPYIVGPPYRGPGAQVVKDGDGVPLAYEVLADAAYLDWETGVYAPGDIRRRDGKLWRYAYPELDDGEPGPYEMPEMFGAWQVPIDGVSNADPLDGGWPPETGEITLSPPGGMMSLPPPTYSTDGPRVQFSEGEFLIDNENAAEAYDFLSGPSFALLAVVRVHGNESLGRILGTGFIGSGDSEGGLDLWYEDGDLVVGISDFPGGNPNLSLSGHEDEFVLVGIRGSLDGENLNLSITWLADNTDSASAGINNTVPEADPFHALMLGGYGAGERSLKAVGLWNQSLTDEEWEWAIAQWGHLWLGLDEPDPLPGEPGPGGPPGTNPAWVEVAPGDPILAYDPQWYFMWVRPLDADGAGPWCEPVAFRLDKADTADLRAGSVKADQIEAASLRTGHFSSVTGILGELNVGSIDPETGDLVGAGLSYSSSRGLRQQDSMGLALVLIPSNGDPARFLGRIEASELEVIDGGTLRGLLHLALGGELRLGTSVDAPELAPILTTSREAAVLGMHAVGTAPAHRRGLVWHDDHWWFGVTEQAVQVGRGVWRCDPDGSNPERAFVNPVDSFTRAGSSWFTLRGGVITKRGDGWFPGITAPANAADAIGSGESDDVLVATLIFQNPPILQVQRRAASDLSLIETLTGPSMSTIFGAVPRAVLGGDFDLGDERIVVGYTDGGWHSYSIDGTDLVPEPDERWVSPAINGGAWVGDRFVGMSATTRERILFTDWLAEEDLWWRYAFGDGTYRTALSPAAMAGGTALRRARLHVQRAKLPTGADEWPVYASTSEGGTYRLQVTGDDDEMAVVLDAYNGSGTTFTPNAFPPGEAAKVTAGARYLRGTGEAHWPELMPPGAIVPYGGASAPDGFLLCDGSAISRSTYAALFAAIGTTFGAGNGTTTFNLPNPAQRFLMGKAASGTGSTLGGTGGTIDHDHGTHNSASNTSIGGAQVRLQGTGAHTAQNPPFLVVNYIIKT